MATSTAVIGTSPITFASEDTATLGQQTQIPLASLSFDAKGAIDASAWPPIKNKKLGTNDTAVVTALLTDLVKRGVLSAPSA